MAVRYADDYQVSAPEGWQELVLLNPAAARMSKKGLGPMSLTFRVSQAGALFKVEIKGIEGRRWLTSRHYESAFKIADIVCLSPRFADLRLPDSLTGNERVVRVGHEVVVRHEFGTYSCRLLPGPRRVRVSPSL